MVPPRWSRGLRDELTEHAECVGVNWTTRKPLSKRIYPEWRGGYYYAAKPRPNSSSTTALPLGLLYVSRWSSPDAAARFAAVYAQSLKQRYKKTETVGTAKSTEDGTVVIEEQGDTVLVSESLDDATTSALEKEVFASPVAK